MKKCKILFIVILLSFTSFSVLSAADHKKKIGIVEFDQRSAINLENASVIIPEMLAEVIVNVGVYEVTERLLLGRVLQEQELAMTGIVDTRTAPQIGKVYGLDALVIGSYMQVGDEITINARLIDTTTGRVIAASTVNFSNIRLLRSQLQITGYELSGISREKMKVLQEDLQKQRFRGGFHLGAGIGNDDDAENSLTEVNFGFFVTSSLLYMDFSAALGRTSDDEQNMIVLYGGGYIGRYFGLGLGIMNTYQAHGYKLDWSDPDRTKAEFLGGFVNLRIRPASNLVINFSAGPALNIEIVDGGEKYKSSSRFSDGSCFLLSVDYYFTENWGVRAFIYNIGGDGYNDAGFNMTQAKMSYGLAATYSMSFGHR